MNDQNFKNYPQTEFDFYLILKIHEIFYKIRELYLLSFYTVDKEKMFEIEKECGRKAPWETINGKYYKSKFW